MKILKKRVNNDIVNNETGGVTVKSLLLVIDLQNAFINKNTKSIPRKIKRIIQNNQYDKIAFTRFINSYDSIFVKKLKYYRCITDEDKKIVIDVENGKVFDKSIYSAVNNELIEFIKENNIEEIYLCGIDTECCVLKTALDLFELGYNVYVLKKYCGSTRGIIRHNKALNTLRRNIGKDCVI